MVIFLCVEILSFSMVASLCVLFIWPRWKSLYTWMMKIFQLVLSDYISTARGEEGVREQKKNKHQGNITSAYFIGGYDEHLVCPLPCLPVFPFFSFLEHTNNHTENNSQSHFMYFSRFKTPKSAKIEWDGDRKLFRSHFIRFLHITHIFRKFQVVGAASFTRSLVVVVDVVCHSLYVYIIYIRLKEST